MTIDDKVMVESVWLTRRFTLPGFRAEGAEKTFFERMNRMVRMKAESFCRCSAGRQPLKRMAWAIILPVRTEVVFDSVHSVHSVKNPIPFPSVASASLWQIIPFRRRLKSGRRG